LIFEGGDTDVRDFALLLKGRDRLSSGDLTPACMNGLKGHVRINRSQNSLDHVAAIVNFGHHSVGTVFIIDEARLPCPFVVGVFARPIFENVTATIGANASDDDPGLVTVLAARDRRIDANDYASHRRQIFRRDSGAFNIRKLPQSADDGIENFGVQFLPTKAGALVPPKDI
jgi:hypothetical protein